MLGAVFNNNNKKRRAFFALRMGGRTVQDVMIGLSGSKVGHSFRKESADVYISAKQAKHPLVGGKAHMPWKI